ncbi:KilA-N domain-containing protein [Candidatus Thiosymbion oneisti]|uniref:KilA-N domain-containing protein n=1 Tax=Candidatus Thiosymbion oneisti TaxID=589554 RepID=UPI000AD77C30|nr:KilA-N domain-containing protein [Candidatus Thiosymbion oneisti]
MSRKSREIEVLDTAVKVARIEEDDSISLTDIARHRDAERTDDLIRNWIRNRNTVEFLGIWEQIHNPGFNPVEFDGFRRQARLNSFTLTPKQWIECTGAVGIVSKAGRYGGPF